MNVSFFRMTFLRVIIQAAAAGGVPAKLIDTLMHECIQVKTSPDGLPPEDSSDAEGEEEEIVAAIFGFGRQAERQAPPSSFLTPPRSPPKVLLPPEAELQSCSNFQTSSYDEEDTACIS